VCRLVGWSLACLMMGIGIGIGIGIAKGKEA
jgi:hypothetical protein